MRIESENADIDGKDHISYKRNIIETKMEIFKHAERGKFLASDEYHWM